ncbi:MAG TPA: MFS transporter [Candidatus Aminicenantes bacterium]|nr:MFS transporter [Candidatus Aminicenantes bacterium]HRY65593.1 MFS transporter [Candidatus Aminicenantes bacterium]HRZ72519.1 MFS transporter [Candidatus Aminicenantes bacterium]
MSRGSGASFWNRDFLLALFGYFFLFMAVSLFFLYPVVLEAFGPSRGRIGLIMGVYSVVAIAIRPFFGRLIDLRGGRRFALLGILLLLAVTPFFHLVRDAGWLPALLRALAGLGWGVSMTATIAMCSDLGPVDRLAKSMGIIGVAGLVANALGPLLAEELLRGGGAARLYNASLLFLAAALACVLAAREMPRGEGGPEAGGLKALKAVPWLQAAVIGAVPVFHGAIRGAMIFFIAVFAGSIGIGRVGPFFVVFSLAAILTRFHLGDVSDRRGRKAVILPAALIIALNLFAIAQVRSLPLLLVTGFVGGLGQGLIFPALSTYIIDFLGRGNKGLAISLYNSLFDVGMGLGAPVFGWISDLAGYRWMYRVAGLLLLVSTAAFMAKAPVTEKQDGVKPTFYPFLGIR